jgi:basic membrane protein A
MKKALSVVLSASMVLAMAAPAFAESATEAPDLDGSDFSVGLVTDVGGVNDGSFNQSAWEGLQKAGEDFGVTVNYLESKTDADYTPNIESFMDEDCDLIICVGYMLADAMRSAAEENPDQKFAIIDDSSCSDLDNVTCLMFRQEQASYLVGYVAGLVTETNTVGFVLGMANDTMNQFGYGYLAGVKDANPDATILQQNANSFSDSATGKSMANQEITNGADVIFHAAGATGLGVIEACQEAKIKAIGVDSDQSSIAPDTVITSAMKRVDNAVYETTEELIQDKLESGIHEYDLAHGGVDIAPTTDLLSDDVIAAVDDVKEKIISGEVVVPKTKEEFEEKYGDIYELDD